MPARPVILALIPAQTYSFHPSEGLSKIFLIIGRDPLSVSPVYPPNGIRQRKRERKEGRKWKKSKEIKRKMGMKQKKKEWNKERK